MAASEEKEPLTADANNNDDANVTVAVPNADVQAVQQFVSMRNQTDIKQVEIAADVDAITCGIGWDFFEKKIDLDVTAIALDSYSFEIDAAYYNQPKILNGAIVHSGDNKTGIGDGDDEQIRIDLRKLPQKCQSLWFIVNCFEGGSFTDVETARFTLYDGRDHSKILYSYGVGMACESTALLLGVLSCQDPYSEPKTWNFRIVESRGTGHNFVESKYLMIDKLSLLYNDGILMERPRDRNQKYKLEKGDVYVIDPAIRNVTVGLGWDASSGGNSIDVDASVIVFDQLSYAPPRRFKLTDIVYYGHKTYGAGAVQHGGDNTTGAGAGDDETILIDLNRLEKDANADVLCVVVNIFSGQSSFKRIRNCFARLLDDGNKELCRFNLTQAYDTKAMIMCHVAKRENGCWALVTDGVGCGGHKASESVDDAVKVLFEDGEYQNNEETHTESEALIGGGHNASQAAGDGESSGCSCVLL